MPQYIEEFISEPLKKFLFKKSSEEKWFDEDGHCVINYGYEYDPSVRRLVSAQPIPKWLVHTMNKLVSQNVLHSLPNQISLAEYRPGQGSDRHIDSNFYKGPVTILSLGSASLTFKSGQRKHNKFLADRSVIVLDGPLRSQTTREIPRRKFDVDGNRRVDRDTYVQITFRYV